MYTSEINRNNVSVHYNSVNIHTYWESTLANLAYLTELSLKRTDELSNSQTYPHNLIQHNSRQVSTRRAAATANIPNIT